MSRVNDTRLARWSEKEGKRARDTTAEWRRVSASNLCRRSAVYDEKRSRSPTAAGRIISAVAAIAATAYITWRYRTYLSLEARISTSAINWLIRGYWSSDPFSEGNGIDLEGNITQPSVLSYSSEPSRSSRQRIDGSAPLLRPLQTRYERAMALASTRAINRGNLASQFIIDRQFADDGKQH